MASLGQPGDLGVEVEEGAVGEALAADVVGAGARLDLQAPGQHLERVRDRQGLDVRSHPRRHRAHR